MVRPGREIVCDSGSLISLTSSCLDDLLYYFSEKHNVRFIIPPSVEEEIVTRPLKTNIRRYLFSALRLKRAIEDDVVVRVDADVLDEARRIMEEANRLFFIRGKPMRLIQLGESEMLALARELDDEYILIDERTTRMLIEAPIQLKKHLEQEFSVNVMVSKSTFDSLKGRISSFCALRSSELIMLAYEHGYFDGFKGLKRSAIEAALLKVRYSGCSIGLDEIGRYLSSVK